MNDAPASEMVMDDRLRAKAANLIQVKKELRHHRICHVRLGSITDIGALAMFAAKRCASSSPSNFAAERRPGRLNQLN